MSQHDYNIANQGASAFRADLNNALGAIQSANSGSSAPSDTAPGMIWYDTTANVYKQRNAADSDWISLWREDDGPLMTQDGTTIYAADSVGTDAYAITLSPAISAYNAGLVVNFLVGTANTGAATLNVNTVGAKTIKKNYNADLATGDLLAGQIVTVAYDAANDTWQLLSPVAAADTGLPTLYNATEKPTYATAATFTVASINCRNDDDDGDISKSGSTTVNLGTTGLNGIAQSSNLTGTISVSSGSAAVTGSGTTFTSDYQVGDVITTAGGNSRRITAVTDNTNMTVESNWGATENTVNHQRGGEAPNTAYNLYAITNGVTPGLILSTRDISAGDTLADLPSGYTKQRQLPFACVNDSSSDLIPFVLRGWGSRQPYVKFNVWLDGTGSGPTNALYVTTSVTSFTDVNLRAFVPSSSRLVGLHTNFFYTGSAIHNLRENGQSHDGIETLTQSASNFTNNVWDVPCDADGIVEYKSGNSATDSTLNVDGFYITEVA